MNKHRHKKTRRCAHCGQPFIVNPRVGKRHRFCTKPACAEASRNLARKKWLRNNGGREYYDLSDRVDRVRTWRKKNPKYWRRHTRVRRRQRNDYVLSKRLAAALRYVALQDMIDTHLALKIGMISEPAAAYVRMSTEHQQYSTENQLDRIKEYAARRNMDIVRVFEDAGKSGLNVRGNARASGR
jgi:hypothetical protein